MDENKSPKSAQFRRGITGIYWEVCLDIMLCVGSYLTVHQNLLRNFCKNIQIPGSSLGQLYQNFQRQSFQVFIFIYYLLSQCQGLNPGLLHSTASPLLFFTFETRSYFVSQPGFGILSQSPRMLGLQACSTIPDFHAFKKKHKVKTQLTKNLIGD